MRARGAAPRRRLPARLGVHDHVGELGAALAHGLLDLAGPAVRRRAAAGRRAADVDQHDAARLGVAEAHGARRGEPVRRRTTSSIAAALGRRPRARRAAGPVGPASGSMWVWTSRPPAPRRGSPPRAARRRRAPRSSGSSARQLHVQRQLVGVAECITRTLWTSRTSGNGPARRRWRARAGRPRAAAGSTCTTTSAPGSRARPPPRPRRRSRAPARRRRPARTATTRSTKSRPAAWRTRTRRISTGRPAARARARTPSRPRPTRGPSARRSTPREPHGGDHDEHGDEQRGDRVAPSARPRATRTRPTSTASEPARSEAKCSALEASAGELEAPRARER